MQKSPHTLIKKRFTTVLLMVWGVFCIPYLASASVTAVSITPSQTNANGTYYANTTLLVNFTLSSTDYTVLGGRYAIVYACLAVNSACHELDGTETAINSGTYTASSLLTLPTTQPEAYGYTAVVVRDASHNYLTEYGINSTSAFGSGGGWLSVAPTVATSPTTTPDVISAFSSLSFYVLVIFFISFILTVWMFRQLMR